jgi:hypothetical protein
VRTAIDKTPAVRIRFANVHASLVTEKRGKSPVSVTAVVAVAGYFKLVDPVACETAAIVARISLIGLSQMLAVSQCNHEYGDFV